MTSGTGNKTPTKVTETSETLLWKGFDEGILEMKMHHYAFVSVTVFPDEYTDFNGN